MLFVFTCRVDQFLIFSWKISFTRGGSTCLQLQILPSRNGLYRVYTVISNKNQAFRLFGIYSLVVGLPLKCPNLFLLVREDKTLMVDYCYWFCNQWSSSQPFPLKLAQRILQDASVGSQPLKRKKLSKTLKQLLRKMTQILLTFITAWSKSSINFGSRKRRITFITSVHVRQSLSNDDDAASTIGCTFFQLRVDVVYEWRTLGWTKYKATCREPLVRVGPR